MRVFPKVLNPDIRCMVKKNIFLYKKGIVQLGAILNVYAMGYSN